MSAGKQWGRTSSADRSVIQEHEVYLDQNNRDNCAGRLIYSSKAYLHYVAAVVTFKLSNGNIFQFELHLFFLLAVEFVTRQNLSQ